MEKYIIIALILLFGIVYYFDKQSEKELVALEQSSTLEIDKNKPKKRSWIKSITNAIKHKNRPDDGIRRVGSNNPDSNTSACVGITKSDKDMIITKFAGYTLQYPCTVNQSGEYHIEYNQEGTILSQRYRLDISVKLGQKNGSFWWDGKSRNQDGVQGFRVQLVNNGKPITFLHLSDNIQKSIYVKNVKEKNYTVYTDNNYVLAVSNKTLTPDSKEYNLYINCDRYGEFEPYELFSPFHKVDKKKSQCTMIWKFTKDIKVIVRLNPKYAYHFTEIYEAINEGLQQIIIERPNNPPKLRES